MAYGYLNSVGATGPLDIGAHTRIRALVRPPDLMGIRGAPTCGCTRTDPGSALPFDTRRCHSTQPTWVKIRLGASDGSSVHLPPGSLCRLIKGILHAIPTGTVMQPRIEARLKNQALTGLVVFG
jgi:hypothetical protein